MADRRPFVDRRLGFVVLFEGNQNVDVDMVEEAAISAIDDDDANVYVTDVNAKSTPPQAKVILNTSSLTPSTLSRISSSLESEMRRMIGPVQTIEVSSMALSPGNKVRNAVGV